MNWGKLCLSNIITFYILIFLFFIIVVFIFLFFCTELYVFCPRTCQVRKLMRTVPTGSFAPGEVNKSYACVHTGFAFALYPLVFTGSEGICDYTGFKARFCLTDP